VLVGDLVASGHLMVQRPDRPVPPREIIERVIRGLDQLD
jgi:hypothetical protein